MNATKKRLVRSRLQSKRTELNSDQEEKYWDTVYNKSYSLVTDTLKRAFPLKDLDLEKDSDWNDLLAEYEINYSDDESFKQDETLAQALAQEITYEYLLLVVRSLLKSLSQFNGHDP